MMVEGINLLVLTVSAFWSSSSSRRQISIPLGGRYRQVSLNHIKVIILNLTQHNACYAF